MIYLDNAATTKVFDCAVRAAQIEMSEQYFNPNATYKSAVAVNDRLECARKQIATAVGAHPDELIFVSCATEANNRIFDCGIKYKKGNIVISAGEHPSVYETAMQYKSRGVDVRIAPLARSGEVDFDALISLVDANTALVSIIHVSNETGVINPIKRISAAVRTKAPKALIHSDGVQALLKLHAPICDLDVDYYSASAHKLGAPKGIGLLYVKRGNNISPLLCGGGQERGLRSGTQNTPYIAAFAAAVGEFSKLADTRRIVEMRQALCKYFCDNGCRIIGDGENSGYILCVCIPDVKAEILQNVVHDNGVIIGKGAACSGAKRGNRVLSAMGLCERDVEQCIRISFTADTNTDDALRAAKIIVDSAQSLRRNNVG